MSCSLVDPLDCFGIRRLGQAEDLAGLRVGPSVLEINPFFALDVEVRLMGVGQLLGGDSVHSLVNVHEFRHGTSSLTNADSDLPESIACEKCYADYLDGNPWGP